MGIFGLSNERPKGSIADFVCQAGSSPTPNVLFEYNLAGSEDEQ